MNTVKRVGLFAAVGTLGFIADSAMLYFLKSSIGLYAGRIVSFLFAVVVTWLFNRFWTFGDRLSQFSASGELFFYLLLMTAGGSVNYAVYAWLVTVSDTVRLAPVLGVAAGSLSGMAINFLSARLLIFREKRIFR
ncbi:GtrA family protein [Microbulbifer sp. SAOS-129_SWC]|uniref:GtrA family protein n=1 Tax=Microbulbifer sp. SAOS-129_SWC TaxID=3145235 RepID=UPI00321656E5